MVRGSTVRGGTSSSKKTQKVTGCQNPFLLVLPTAEEEAVLYLESGVGHTTSRNAHLRSTDPLDNTVFLHFESYALRDIIYLGLLVRLKSTAAKC